MDEVKDMGRVEHLRIFWRDECLGCECSHCGCMREASGSLVGSLTRVPGDENA